MRDLSYENRFGGIERVLGTGALGRLEAAHVMVVGLGGVGSWAVEALARSGIGTLSLVDLDDVCATNTNRQLHALDPEWGRLKVEVLAERAARIQPRVVIHAHADFFTAKSAEALLASSPTMVIDAMDSVADKVALVLACRRLAIPLVLSGGAGGKSDPTKVRTADLARETGDSLLKSVKRQLKNQGIRPDEKGLWNLSCVYSEEPSVLPWDVCSAVPRPDEGGSSRIDCAAGFGALAFATGAFGLALASHVVLSLVNKRKLAD